VGGWGSCLILEPLCDQPTGFGEEVGVGGMGGEGVRCEVWGMRGEGVRCEVGLYVGALGGGWVGGRGGGS